MKIKKCFLIGSILLLPLSGCSVPNSMPTGYTYHQDVYKSATPAPSAVVSKKQRRYMDAAQAEQFRDAVYDILQRITSRAGMPPKPVFVLQPKRMSTFYNNIDNDLRESMRTMGYAISDIPQGSYVFVYDARSLEQPRGVSSNVPNVEIILKVFDSAGANARMLTQEVGRYYIQGAEYLNILPAQYNDGVMPSRESILQQEHRFDERLAPKLMEENAFVQTPSVSSFTIKQPDSYYISRDVEVNKTISMPRARISKKIDY